jgi:hypothetical protein
MQDGAGAVFHEALMSSERWALIAFRLTGRAVDASFPPYSETKWLPRAGLRRNAVIAARDRRTHA